MRPNITKGGGWDFCYLSGMDKELENKAKQMREMGELVYDGKVIEEMAKLPHHEREKFRLDLDNAKKTNEKLSYDIKISKFQSMMRWWPLGISLIALTISIIVAWDKVLLIMQWLKK